MRTCPACSFENMNNSRLCGRCGAKLVWDGPTDRGSFEPPRAGWNKALYPLAYFVAAKTPFLYTMAVATQRLPSDRVAAAALSILPGLGHFYLGERDAALRAAAVWLAPLMLAIFLYYSAPRVLLFFAPLIWIMLMVIHSFVVASAARPGSYGKSILEVRTIWLILLALVWLLYLVVGYAIQSSLVVWLEVRVVQ
jgi:hypothetical protein